MLSKCRYSRNLKLKIPLLYLSTLAVITLELVAQVVSLNRRTNLGQYLIVLYIVCIHYSLYGEHPQLISFNTYVRVRVDRLKLVDRSEYCIPEAENIPGLPHTQAIR